MSEWSDQRGEQRRHDDRELAAWRGEFTARMQAVERTTRMLESQLNGIQAGMAATRQDVAVIRTTMEDQSDDIAAGQASNRAILLYLIFPLIVAILAGFVLFVATGGLH